MVQEEGDVEQKRRHQRFLDELSLGIIDVLDLIEELQKGSEVILRKVAKRLQALLKKHEIQEFGKVGDGVVPGHARVLETRHVGGEVGGKVVEVCRKGYLAAERVLRPADVITSRETT